MNGPIKRAAVACLAMFALADDQRELPPGGHARRTARDDARNTRNYYARYAVQRGRITAGGKVILAQSKDTGDFKFRQREYPEGKLYAHLTGFFSPESASAIEAGREQPARRLQPRPAAAAQHRPVHRRADQGRQRRPHDQPQGAEGRLRRAAAERQARRGGRARPQDRGDPRHGLAAHLRPGRAVGHRTRARCSTAYDEAGQGRRPAAAQPQHRPHLPAGLDLQGGDRRGLPGGRLRPGRPDRSSTRRRCCTLPNTTAELPNYGGAAVRLRAGHARLRAGEVLQHAVRQDRHGPRLRQA